MRVCACEQLRTALIQLKVFLTDEEATAIVTELDVDRNGTIERGEWERGIVMQKYKIYLLLSMANRHLQVCPSLAGVVSLRKCGSVKKSKSL